MKHDDAIATEIVDNVSSIDAADWNALCARGEPFLEHEFLTALERSGSVGEGTAWIPRHVLAFRDSKLVGAIPTYIKLDSYGEFIFDWQWADAYRRAGIRYYPKVVSAVPFTPVTGRRILLAGGETDAAAEAVTKCLLDRVDDVAGDADASGVHLLFATSSEVDTLEDRGFLRRLTYQFHWENRGYESFEDFLADLRSTKRKQIRKERRNVSDTGLRIDVLEGDAVRAEHLLALHDLHMRTVERKWSQMYLNRSCFEELAQTFRHRLVLVTARDGERIVGGTVNVRKDDHLYGRYWGALGYVDSLHFECCFYRLIEFAIESGVTLFEAGAQGEQKFLRGFVTRPTWSAHRLAHPRGHAAIAAYVGEEHSQMSDTITQYNAQSPVKTVRASAQAELARDV